MRYIFKTFHKINLEYLKRLLYDYQIGLYKRYKKKLDTISVNELNERLEKILEILIYSENRLENVNWSNYYVFISSEFSIDIIKKNILKSIINNIKNAHGKDGYSNQVIIYTYIDDMDFKSIYKNYDAYKERKKKK